MVQPQETGVWKFKTPVLNAGAGGSADRGYAGEQTQPYAERR